MSTKSSYAYGSIARGANVRHYVHMQTLITHSGSFHADDVFATAALQMLLGVGNTRIIRTRDETVIETGDWVYDVGGIYDPTRKRFDHHQNGAPVRDNGIPYAAFGLVWKEVGSQLAGSDEAAALIEARLVFPIDAGDNGISLYSLSDIGVEPFGMHDFIGLFSPTWGSGESKDDSFQEAVSAARDILSRAIAHAKADLTMRQLVRKGYEQTEDKRLLIFDVTVPQEAFIDFPDVEVVVCPYDVASSPNWEATTIRKHRDSFEPRVQFPAEWAGLRNDELAKVSGVPDAVFCHKARFYFVAGSKEGALAGAAKAR